MTYASDVLALVPNLRAGWKFNEAAGAAQALDITPNALHLDYPVGGKVNDDELINGYGSSARFAGSAVASRNAPTQLYLTDSVAMFAAVRVNALPSQAAGGPHLVGGRSQNFQLLIAWNGAVSFVIGNNVAAAASTTRLVAGYTYFLVGSFSGRNVRVGINGTWVARKSYVGTIASTNAPMVVGGGNSDISLNGLYISGNSTDKGTHRRLFLVGFKGTINDGFLVDDKLNDSDPLVAGTAIDTYCAHNGGAMRTIEPRVIDAAGLASHIGGSSQLTV